jgi:hypothetical protein
MATVYQRTPIADQILANGFTDARNRYGFGIELMGVWMSDTPLTSSQGATGAIVLAVDIPDAVLAKYEACEGEVLTEGGDRNNDADWIPTDKKPYREFLVPAAVVNQYGPPRIHRQD